MEWITEERIGQYKTKRNAKTAAKLATIQTGIKHYPVVSYSFRDLEPKLCYTIIVKN